LAEYKKRGKKRKEGERRGREQSAERGREGERGRGREGERERGREGERERGRMRISLAGVVFKRGQTRKTRGTQALAPLL
jgi:hypothetical protein